MKTDKTLRKPISIRWGQSLWARLGRWSKQSGYPIDAIMVRVLMLPLLPIYIRRLGLIEGIQTLYRFMFTQDGFTIHRSEMDPGQIIRSESTDAFVFQQVFILGDYKKLGHRQDVKVIIDAGAYVGYSAVYFAELYPHAFIYALEPEESNFQALQKNTRNYPNILAIQAALWKHDGFLEVHDGDAGQWSFTVQETGVLKHLRRIPAITIKTLVDQYRLPAIDILKIDIEGSENSVFESADCHEWLPLVRTLAIELHDHLFPGSDQSFLEAMSRYEYAVKFSGENMILDFDHKKPVAAAPDKIRKV